MSVLKCVVRASHEVRPKEDSDRDGIRGVCPECQSVAPLTKKGFIGAHTVRGESTPGPARTALTEKQRPAVDKGVTKSPTIGARQGEQMVDGAPLVKGRAMPPVQPMRVNKATGEREVSSIGTMGGNIGRERLDRDCADPRPVARRTPSQRSNYRAKMRRLAAKSARQASKR